MDQRPKEKRVKIEKLNLMTDEQLKSRIDEATQKIEGKKKRYLSTHEINMVRLTSYTTYKIADKDAATKILADRQKKKALPTGGLGNSQRAVA